MFFNIKSNRGRDQIILNGYKYAPVANKNNDV
jgi:hypothetical protein